jgi:hypothetical protein
MVRSRADGVLFAHLYPFAARLEWRDKMLKRSLWMILAVMLVFSLVGPVSADEGETEQGEGSQANFFCMPGVTAQHPMGLRLAQQFSTETYTLTYETVMAWFCQGGYGFGQIKLALQTAAATGVDPAVLLASKTEMGGWGQVWKEYGKKGKPGHAGPPWSNGKSNKDKSGGEGEEGERIWEGEGPPPWARGKGRDK